MEENEQEMTNEEEVTSEFTCPNCGQVNRVSAKFCVGCGATFLAGRFVLLNAGGQPNDGVGYDAFDMWRCHNLACGAMVEEATTAVCPVCGAAPRQALPCVLYKQAFPPHPAEADSDKIESWFYDEREDVWYGVKRPIWNLFPHGQQLVVGQATHPGQNYDHNEDSVLVQATTQICNDRPKVTAVLAVADGMGGHHAGDIASRLAINGLLADIMPDLPHFSMSANTLTPTQLTDRFKQAVAAANTAVYTHQQQTQTDSGTTITAVFIHQNKAIIANAGDSRTYLFRNGQLKQITEDHSVVYLLVKKKQITPEEIYTHPDKNQIYRNLGDKQKQEIDTFFLHLKPNDRLILCSDGLWEMVRDEGLAQTVSQIPEAQSACHELIKYANAAGGEDNISVIIAHILAEKAPE